ncbi:MAG: hypothetical protein HY716_10960 [Planctomycetes bacterium]|nr:hypothetical protein [Planctomycetota bacterium]
MTPPIRAMVGALLLLGFAPQQSAQELLLQKTQSLQKEVTALRGLEFKKDVAIGSYTREELVDFLRKEQERELPKEKLDRLQKVYVHFGLLPDPFDLHQSLLDLFGSTIAGFYHPRTKELRIIKGPGAPDYAELEEAFEERYGLKVKMEEITLVHELCHAAQDQHHDLTTLPIDIDDNDDLSLAIRAVVEGDAMAVGLKYGFKDQFDAMSRIFSEDYKTGALPGPAGALPAYLRRTHTFPYGFGTEFAIQVLYRAKGDWKALSKPFLDLPASTEQVMHPRKYLGEERDHPQRVALEGLGTIVGAGGKEIAHNVHGEFGVLVLLDEFKQGTARERRAAAEGWDGDRYHLYEDDGGRVFSIWYSTWDSEEDAAEFFSAYSALLQAKHSGAKKESSAQKIRLESPTGARAVLEHRGAEVLALDGVDEELEGKLNAIWSCARKTELKTVERVPPKK